MAFLFSIVILYCELMHCVATSIDAYVVDSNDDIGLSCAFYPLRDKREVGPVKIRSQFMECQRGSDLSRRFWKRRSTASLVATMTLLL